LRHVPDYEHRRKVVSADRYRHLIDTFVRATTEGPIDLLDTVMTDDYEQVDSDVPNGRSAVKMFFTMGNAGLSDQSARIIDYFETDDRIATRLELTATHSGTFMGLVATGKTVHIESVDLYWVRDGLLARHYGLGNHFRYLTEMGIIEPGWPFSGVTPE
jgi:predicted ester cyclase